MCKGVFRRILQKTINVSSNLDTWIEEGVVKHYPLFIHSSAPQRRITMNQILSFTYEANTNIRTTTEDGTPFFCANDIATTLGYSDPKDAPSPPLPRGRETLHPY